MRIVAADPGLRLAYERIADVRRVPRLGGDMLCAVDDAGLIAAAFYERTSKVLLIMNLTTNPLAPLLRRHHAAVQLGKTLRTIGATQGLVTMALAPLRLRSLWRVLKRAGLGPGKSPVMIFEAQSHQLDAGEPRARKRANSLAEAIENLRTMPPGPGSIPSARVVNGAPPPDVVSTFAQQPSASSEASALVLPSLDAPSHSVSPPSLFVDRRPKVTEKPVAGKRRQGKVS